MAKTLTAYIDLHSKGASAGRTSTHDKVTKQPLDATRYQIDLTIEDATTPGRRVQQLRILITDPKGKVIQDQYLMRESG